jgi:hypothetical protein
LTAGDKFQHIFSIHDSDSSIDSLIIEVQEKPEGLELKKVYDNHYHLSWTTTLEDVGKHKVRFSVINESGLKSTSEFFINVKENKIPSFVKENLEYKSILGELVTIKFTVEDFDIFEVKFSLKLIKAPKGMTLKSWGIFGLSHSNILKWNPTKDQIGSHEVIVEGTDEFNRKFKTTLTVTVEPNKKPIITGLVKVKKGTVGVQLNYAVEIKDDNDSSFKELEFQLKNAPEGMTIGHYNFDQYIIKWTPKKGQEGDHKVTLIVTDKYSGVVSKELTFNIEKNKPPTIKLYNQISSIYRPEEEIRLRLRIEDPDTPWDQLSYRLSSAPNGAHVFKDRRRYRRVRNIYWTPKREHVGEQKIVFEVTDPLSGESVYHTFNLKIRPLTKEEKKE